MSEHYYDEDRPRSPWPSIFRPLVFVQLTLSAAILLHSAWQQLSSPLTTLRPLDIITITAAFFSLFAAVFNASSSRENLNVLEVVVPDTLSLALWSAVVSSIVAAAVDRNEMRWPTAGGAASLCAVLAGKLMVAAWVQVSAVRWRQEDEEAGEFRVVVISAPVEKMDCKEECDTEGDVRA